MMVFIYFRLIKLLGIYYTTVEFIYNKGLVLACMLKLIFELNGNITVWIIIFMKHNIIVIWVKYYKQIFIIFELWSTQNLET